MANIDHLFKLGDAVKHKEPAFAKVVTLVSCKLENLLNHKQVLILDPLVARDRSKLTE